MSGSYDRPDGRRSTAPTAPDYDPPYDDVVTGHRPGADAQGYAYDAPPANTGAREQRHDFTAARGRPAERKRQTPVVPPDSVTSRSLTLVITIMCFLACLTAGAVYMINESKNAWLKDIASEMTVQVEPRENVDIEKSLADVQAFLQSHAGIERANAVSLADSAILLEPWLGKSDVLASLPVPRLIALEVDRDNPPDVDALRADLAKKYQGVTLDDHRHWQRQIRTVTRSFALGGLGILLLVAAATTAVIISATRSAMASNREIIEVLHLVGATDRYIAREFEKHFLRLGVRAGLVGAACAMGVFLSMTAVMELLGGGDVTVAEVHRLVGTGGLDIAGYLILGGVIVIIAALCMLTSRLGVFRVLNTKP
jgi:cell division transport system permease protein